jgi:hypothetical protein
MLDFRKKTLTTEDTEATEEAAMEEARLDGRQESTQYQ